MQSWKTCADEDCEKIKTIIYKIIPEWTDEKIGFVLALNDQYVCFREEGAFEIDEESVLYNIKSGEFVKSEKNWRIHLPLAYQTIQTFSTKSLFGQEMMLVFFKETGLYGACIKKDCSSFHHLWFENRNVMEECITYYKNNTSFTMESESKGDDEMRYDFDSLKLVDRVNRWFEGGWKTMEELGMLSDAPHIEKWTIGYSTYEPVFRTTTFDDFIRVFNDVKEQLFSCDLCHKECLFRNIMHCLDCVSRFVIVKVFDDDEGRTNDVINCSYNECMECHKKSTHEHAMTDASDQRLIEKYTQLFS
jgi:hypothetical protein